MNEPLMHATIALAARCAARSAPPTKEEAIRIAREIAEARGLGHHDVDALLDAARSFVAPWDELLHPDQMLKIDPRGSSVSPRRAPGDDRGSTFRAPAAGAIRTPTAGERIGSSALDLLDVVDAAYKVDLPDAQWLRELAHAARPHLDQGFGLTVFEYFRPEGMQPRITQRFHLGIPDELESIYGTVFAKMDPAIRLRPFRLGPCITGSEMMGLREKFRDEPLMKKFVQRFGMYDSIWITAAEPSGHGVGFHAGLPSIQWASLRQKKRWSRVAAHLSTAVRLRHALRGRDAKHAGEIGEAILGPKERVHDASSSARSPSARELLRRAVLALEKSRGTLRDIDSDASFDVRKALVNAGWSLLDRVELDGKRYILACETPPSAPGLEALSAQERRVLAYAKLGHHNRLIAEELGISYSTVRVLLARAASKLGVRSRRDLLRLFEDGSRRGRAQRPPDRHGGS